MDDFPKRNSEEGKNRDCLSVGFTRSKELVEESKVWIGDPKAVVGDHDRSGLEVQSSEDKTESPVSGKLYGIVSFFLQPSWFLYAGI